MASRKVKLNELKVAELKRELEEQDEDSSGKKVVLRQRLWTVLEEAVERPEKFLFTVAGDMDDILNLFLGNSPELRRENLKNSRELKQYFLECSRNMEQKLEDRS